MQKSKMMFRPRRVSQSFSAIRQGKKLTKCIFNFLSVILHFAF